MLLQSSMPASGGGGEEGILSSAIHLGTSGAAFGALGGCVQSAWYGSPDALVARNLARNVATHAGMLGAIGAVFGATEALATSTRGPSMLNSMVAGRYHRPQTEPQPELQPVHHLHPRPRP